MTNRVSPADYGIRRQALAQPISILKPYSRPAFDVPPFIEPFERTKILKNANIKKKIFSPEHYAILSSIPVRDFEREFEDTEIPKEKGTIKPNPLFVKKERISSYFKDVF